MTRKLIIGGLWAMAGLCAFNGRLAAQNEAQPQVSATLTDSSGRPIGAGQPAAKVKVTGRVLDAESGQPLPVFTLTEGRQDRRFVGIDWEETGRKTFSKGVFDVSVVKERLAPAVLIEAPGYLPQSSGCIYGLGTNLAFLLKKGSGPAGVVLTPDGRPAAGRTVYLSRWRDMIFIQGPQLEVPTNTTAGLRLARTDAAGRFFFAPDIDAYAVLVVDAAGFAEKRVEDLKTSPELRLQPCAVLEGTLRIGAKPGSNETVRLTPAFGTYAYYPRPLPPYTLSVEATTDGAGHFVFPRVPPVDVKIFHSPKLGTRQAGSIPVTQITNVTLKPGETRQVILGGQGRPVVGRVVLQGYDKALDWRKQVCWMESLEPDPPGLPNFDALRKEREEAVRAARTPEARIAAQARFDQGCDQVARQFQAFYASAEGRRYLFSKRRYDLQFAQDGSFRVEDVPGGKYQLTIDALEPDAGTGPHRAPSIPITVHRQKVEVPDSPGGRSDTPFDLGAIETLPRLYAGAMGPDFSVKTLDDKTIKLSDFRGKFVLLDFWAAGDAPCAAETPYLMEAYAAFKDNPRFAMIGLSVDANARAPRDYAQNNHLAWPQGFLGQGSDVSKRYGVERLPSILLIGPDGRVAVTGLRGGTIKSTVDAALNPQ